MDNYSSSLVAAPASIGNYKGIMLCNRPMNAVNDNYQNMNNNNNGDEKKTFVCGVVPDAIGQTVSILNKERVKAKKEKKDSVLSKHKKWLQDLQKAKDQIEIDCMLEAKRKEEMFQRLADQSRKQRFITTTSNDSKSESKMLDESKESPSDYKTEFNQTAEEKTGSSSSSSAIVASSSSSSSSSNKVGNSNAINNSNKASDSKVSNRPAWSMTEKAAERSAEQGEFEDLDALLEFAEGLDYNKCINDIEVKLMIDQMKKKIGEMEKEIADEEKKLQANASSYSFSHSNDIALKKAKLQQMGEAISSLALEETKAPEDRSAASLLAAKSVLENDVEIQNVHSTRSIAAMIKSTLDVSTDAQPKVYNEPKTVVHEPNEGLRVNKLDASNLPYLHRNPAV